MTRKVTEESSTSRCFRMELYLELNDGPRQIFCVWASNETSLERLRHQLFFQRPKIDWSLIDYYAGNVCLSPRESWTIGALRQCGCISGRPLALRFRWTGGNASESSRLYAIATKRSDFIGVPGAQDYLGGSVEPIQEMEEAVEVRGLRFPEQEDPSCTGIHQLPPSKEGPPDMTPQSLFVSDASEMRGKDGLETDSGCPVDHEMSSKQSDVNSSLYSSECLECRVAEGMEDATTGTRTEQWQPPPIDQVPTVHQAQIANTEQLFPMIDVD